MATRSIRGGDWISVASEQAKSARATNGVQTVQGIASIPFTPGALAFQMFQFWNASVSPVFLAGFREGKDIPAGAVAGIDSFAVVLSGNSLFLTDIPKKVAGNTDSAAVKQSATRIDTALRTMLDSMAKGSSPGSRNLAGLLCLDIVNGARFWEATTSLGREFSFLASSTSITAEEFWTAVKEGAKDGLRDVGEAAGDVLSTAGEGLGAGISGFIKGLGVVNTAIILGGGYVVGRYVF
jgi:hypothetical protein